jgi:HNH endonuclease
MDIDLLQKTYNRFANSYDLEKQIDTSKYSKKTYYDLKSNPQYCRFCEKIYPEVSFKTESHLIPKFLGSKYLLSHFECDDCNSKFKLYENDLANFIGAIRSIVGIKGKSKNPKYVKKDLMIFQEEDQTIQFVSPEIFESIQNGEKDIMIKTTKDKFTPSNAYKALLKIALCLVEEEDISNFRNAFKFLTSDDEELNEKMKNSMNVIRIFVPGPSIPQNPIVHLFKRKDNTIELPERIMVIHIRNLKYQIPLPFNSNDNYLIGKTLDVPMYPIILKQEYAEKFGNFQFEAIDLSSKNIVINKNEGIGLKIKDLKRYNC